MIDSLPKTTFHCECYDSKHHFHVIHDLEENEISIEIRPSHYLPWYRRIWMAIKFIFKRDDQWYSETIISEKDRMTIAQMLLWKKPEIEVPAKKNKGTKNVGKS